LGSAKELAKELEWERGLALELVSLWGLETEKAQVWTWKLEKVMAFVQESMLVILVRYLDT
jgi:hypothetical protein